MKIDICIFLSDAPQPQEERSGLNILKSYLEICYVCKWLGHDMNMGYMSCITLALPVRPVSNS